MQNLEQIRAKHALAACNSEQAKFVRSDVAGFPALILQNGILAAFAFANEEGKVTRQGLKHACNAIASHLSHRITTLHGKTTASDLITTLSRASNTDIQRATTEALHFLSYLKRFAQK